MVSPITKGGGIEKIGFYKIVYPMRGNFFRLLRPIFAGSTNLTEVGVSECSFGDGCAAELATSLAACSPSLKSVTLSDNIQGATVRARADLAPQRGGEMPWGIVVPGADGGFNVGGGPMTDGLLLEALGGHAQLEVLKLNGMAIGTDRLKFVSALLRRMNALKELGLGGNDFDDSGLEVLAAALSDNCPRVVNLMGNRQVSPQGWHALAAFLKNEECPLEALLLNRNDMNDDTVVAFADALKCNRRLKYMYLDTYPITKRGWDAMEVALCDPSSPNATYHSNHTLERLGVDANLAGTHKDVAFLLNLNYKGGSDKKGIILDKMLLTHRSFDFRPLLIWDIKMMPLVLGWLEGAAKRRISKNDATYDELTGRMKLSALYDFVRGRPEEFERRPKEFMVAPGEKMGLVARMTQSPMVMAAVAVAVTAAAIGLFEVRRGAIFSRQ